MTPHIEHLWATWVRAWTQPTPPTVATSFAAGYEAGVAESRAKVTRLRDSIVAMEGRRPPGAATGPFRP